MKLTVTQLRELRRAPVPSAYGNRIGIALALAGATLKELSEGAGLSYGYVSDVKSGRYPTITVDNAGRIAAVFGCHIEDLFPSRQKVSA